METIEKLRMQGAGVGSRISMRCAALDLHRSAGVLELYDEEAGSRSAARIAISASRRVKQSPPGMGGDCVHCATNRFTS